MMGMSALLRFDRARCGDSAFLVGIDEAGRGALAGPVVAGAVFLRPAQLRSSWARKVMAEVNDSKQLTPECRERLFGFLEEARGVGAVCGAATGEGSVAEIASRNILGANREAMRRALEAARPPDAVLPRGSDDEEGGLFKVAEAANVRVLIDGKPVRPFPYRHEGIVKGDAKSFVIALASILAKVTRDRLMTELDADFPEYGFALHKGYGTPHHRAALLRHGPSPLHRALFLRKILGPEREAKLGGDQIDWADVDPRSGSGIPE